MFAGTGQRVAEGTIVGSRVVTAQYGFCCHDGESRNVPARPPNCLIESPCFKAIYFSVGN